MACSLPGSLVHGILQARTLERVVMPSSRGSSEPRNWTCISYDLHWQTGSLPLAPSGKPILCIVMYILSLQRGREMKDSSLCSEKRLYKCTVRRCPSTHLEERSLQTPVCWHIDLGLGSLQNYEAVTSYCLGPSVHGVLLWQPILTNKLGNIRDFSLFVHTAVKYSLMWVYYSLFNQSPIDIHLYCL